MITYIVESTVRIVLLVYALLYRTFAKVDEHKIICWSYLYSNYSCNPRALTEYVLSQDQNVYKVVWAFKHKENFTGVDKRIKCVICRTIDYIHELYTSKYIISNMRSGCVLDTFFVKRKNQKYIMTWHGGFPLKKIEADAVDSLQSSYIREAKFDSSMCDLMISNSKMFTRRIKDAFWYEGEILEEGLPRNDIFYKKDQISSICYKIKKELNIPQDSKIVLYAPTFRNNSNSLEYYNINWDNVMPSLRKFLGGEVVVLVRLHPNMSSMPNIDSLCNYDNVINITSAPDITPYLCSANMFISDYTSAMFDYIILNMACFIYATDINTYDRGFYYKIKDLPFPIAEDEEQLINNISQFSYSIQTQRIKKFVTQEWGLKEEGKASEKLFEWIKRH